MFNFCCKFLISDARSSSKCANWFFAIAASFALAALALLLVDRTVLHIGARPHSLYLLPLALFIPLFIALPARVPELEPSSTFRCFPVALALVPLLPLPLQIAASLLGVVGILAWVPMDLAKRYAGLVMACAMAWLVCLFTVHLYGYVESRLTDVTWLAAVLVPAFRALGQTVTHEGTYLYLTHHGITIRVLPGPDKFGSVFLPCLLAVFLAFAFMMRFNLRLMFSALAILIAYAITRTATLLSASLGIAEPIHWWKEEVILLSYLPVILLLGMLTPFAIRMMPSEDRQSTLRWLPRHVLNLAGFTSTLLLVLGWHWTDPGVQKTGAIMVDERYSRWEWSEDPIDTTRYGVKTVYNYYNLIEEIGRYFPIRRNFDDITAESLADVSVLILKTPTEPYSQEALEAIWSFVAQGGGLWMIGDHTNVFGMSTYLNQVGQPYGIYNEYDSVIDPEAIRQISNFSASDHPITRRLPTFIWMTGNTLRAPWGHRDVINTPRLLMDRADYSTNAGFGNFRPDLDESVGSVIQAAAIPAGKGRVAIWSDSTIFSNFAVFLPGRMELALGYVDWLNRSNSQYQVRPMMLIVGSVLLVVTFLPRMRLSRLPALWPGVLTAFIITPMIYDRHYPAPIASKEVELTAFLELEGSVRVLPVYHGTQDPSAQSYLTAFIAAQRAKQRPFVARSLDEAGAASVLVVVHGNYRTWASDEIDTLLAQVRGGATLILLDSGHTLASAALYEQIGERVGFTVEAHDPPAVSIEMQRILEQMSTQPSHSQVRSSASRTIRGTPIVDRHNAILGRYVVSGIVRGGDRWITLRDDIDAGVLVRFDYGEGTVFLSTAIDLYSDLSLGMNHEVPQAHQFATLRWLFAMYGDASAIALAYEDIESAD